jgi:hypothetical protein
VVGTYNSPDGKDRDRSVKDAYLKIIPKARNYIYIEDQYLVNLDVAKALNDRIKNSSFKKLIVAIQDSRETTDIMIPDRKRGAFIDAVLQDTNEEEKKKFSLFMIDDDLAKSSGHHPGMHAKTLIVDDELAGRLDDVRIETSAQPSIGGDHDEQRAPVRRRRHAQQRVGVLIDPRDEPIKDLQHALRERPGRDDALLRASQARRRDHLHRLGDLLRRLDGADPPAEVYE